MKDTEKLSEQDVVDIFSSCSQAPKMQMKLLLTTTEKKKRLTKKNRHENPGDLPSIHTVFRKA